jgi:hypothetical protein
MSSTTQPDTSGRVRRILFRSSGEPQRRRRSGRGRRALIALGCAAVLVWMLPTIVAHTPLRNGILASVLSDLRGTVSAGGASFGWFTPVVLYDVELRDASGRTACRIARVEFQRTFRGLWANPQAPGAIRLVKPHAFVHVDERGTNFEQIFAAWLQPSSADARWPQLTLELDEGIVSVEDPTSNHRWQLQNVRGSVHLPEVRAAPADIRLAGIVAQPDRSAEFDGQARLHLDAARPAAGITSVQARWKSTGFPLDLLQPFVARWWPRTVLEGYLTSDTTCTWTQELPGRWRAEVQTQTQAEGLSLIAPQLGNDVLRLESLQLPCRIVCTPQELSIEKFAATCDVGKLELDGRLQVDLRDGLPRGLAAALRQHTYQLRGELDLARLAMLLPGTMRVRADTQITSGKVDLLVSRRAAGDVAHWNVQVQTTQLQALHAQQVIAWQKPVRLELVGAETPQGPMIEHLLCKSDFFDLEMAGEPRDLTAAAEFNLARLAGELGKFFDLGGMELAGDGWLYVNWSVTPDGRFTTDGECQIRDFHLALPDQPAWHENNMVLLAAFTGQMPAERATGTTPQPPAGGTTAPAGATTAAGGTNAPAPGGTGSSGSSVEGRAAGTLRSEAILAPDDLRSAEDPLRRVAAARPSHGTGVRLDSGHVQLRSGVDELRVELAAAVGQPSSRATWPLRVALRGAAERWLQRVRPWWALPEDWRLQGECDLAAQGSFSPQRIALQSAALQVRQATLSRGDWLVRQPQIDCEASGQCDLFARRAELQTLKVQAPGVSLESTALQVHFPTRGGPTARATVRCRGDLAALTPWLQSLVRQSPPPGGPAAPTATTWGSISAASLGAAPAASLGTATAMAATMPAAEQAVWRCAGQTTGTLQFAWAPHGGTVQYEGELRDLQLHYAGQDAWRESHVRLASAARYDARRETADIDYLAWESDLVRGDIKGQIAECRGRGLLRLSGTLEYDTQRLLQLLRPLVGSGIQVVDARRPRPFSIEGALWNDPSPGALQLPWHSRLVVRAATSWTGADVYGVRLGAGELRAELRDGRIDFAPIDMAVHGGRLTMQPQVLLAADPPRLRLEPGRVLHDVRVDQGFVKYLVPPLAGADRLEGIYSMDISGCRVPLHDPAASEVAGKLLIRNLEFTAGPLSQQLAAWIDVGRRVAGLPARATTEVQRFRIKPASDVAFRMVHGRVYHRDLVLEYGDVTIVTYGSVGLDRTIALMAEVRLPPVNTRNPQVAALLAQGLDIPVDGTLDQPRLDTDHIRSQLAGAASSVLNVGAEAASRTLLEEATRRLENLFRP